MKGVLFNGTLEIKCKKCGTINNIGTFEQKEDENHYTLIMNEKGVIINVDKAASNILGYSREELIGKHFTSINHTLPKEIAEKFFGHNSILSEENHFKLDTYHRAKNGKNIFITSCLRLHKINEKERWVLVFAKLKKNEDNKNKTFLDNTCDFYFDIDKNGLGEYVSPRVEKVLEISQTEIIGKNYFDFILEEKREKEKKIFEYFSSRVEPFRVERNFIAPCGRNIYTELYFTSRFDDYGEFIGYHVLGWVKKPILT